MSDATQHPAAKEERGESVTDSRVLAPLLGIDPTKFLRRLLVTAASFVIIALLILFLSQFRVVLQPLFLAVFLGYLILPIHRWIVDRGVSSPVGYVLILLAILALLVTIGVMIYASVEDAVTNWEEYEKNLDSAFVGLQKILPASMAEHMPQRVRDLPLVNGEGTDPNATVRAVLGSFFDFFGGLALTFIFLVFLVIERVTFPNRIVLALGKDQGNRVLGVMQSINQAIAQYVSVKTFISLLTGLFSFVVLWAFGVNFFLLWGILIFLFNYIPYLGSLVLVSLVSLLAFVQFADEPWKGVAVLVLLTLIQQVMGAFIEPRMAGQKLGVSPLLLVLSLAFWGMLWGVVGMLLAVPLAVVIKIILENIKETKPLAILGSNL